jgi:hypothetical protein
MILALNGYGPIGHFFTHFHVPLHRVGDSNESLFFHGAVAVTFVCIVGLQGFALYRLQLYLYRSNFYPADFLPERPSSSFKELCRL